jgi:hypothetical protein
MLIKTATDLRFVGALELALSFAAAMTKAILGSTYAVVPLIESLTCLTKIYNLAHTRPRPRTRLMRKPRSR